MNEHFNEEMAWRHLQDLQLEMENHRLVDAGGPALGWWLPRLARRLLPRLAPNRPFHSASGAGLAPNGSN